ncbi:MAG: hypothetical protein AB7K24_21550 [Gemmataceae bacterium]
MDARSSKPYPRPNEIAQLAAEIERLREQIKLLEESKPRRQRNKKG